MELLHIQKQYGTKEIFHDYNASFKQGSRYCIMGESGRGKTTLLRMIAGLETYDQGEIVWDAVKKVSVVFQENRLFEWATVEKNIALVQKKKQFIDITRHLQKVKLDGMEKKKISELSGGMKRRVAIVRAMVAESSLVLMDEPFTGLDLDTKKEVIQYVLEQQKGRTLLISTHSKEEVSLLQAEMIQL